MAQPAGSRGYRRGVFLPRLLIAGALLVLSTGERAYPEGLDPKLAGGPAADVIVPAGTITGGRSFAELWAADFAESSKPHARLAAKPAATPKAKEPVVYFAFADTVDNLDTPFAALLNDDALPMGPPSRSIDQSVANDALPEALRAESEVKCLASAMYFEARGEGRRGELAVAQVVVNRVKSPGYPKTICGVVYQNASIRNGCQFSFACDGLADRINDPNSWRIATDLARKVVAGDSTVFLADVGNATFFHATDVEPVWASHMKRMDRIGRHIFYAPYGASGLI